MIKLISSPNPNKLVQHRSKIGDLTDLAQAPVTGGMVTNIPAISIENEQCTLLKDYSIYNGRTRRRAGLLPYAAVKPNSNKVLGLVAYDKSDGTVRFVRFTKNSVHTAGLFTWYNITGPPLNGTDKDWFRTINVEDRLLFTNNGIDEIQELDTTTNTYARLGNAERFKYIVSFGDRILGLNGGGIVHNPNFVAWSGNRNFDEWNPLVDPSAGSTILSNSSGDLSDPITGAVTSVNSLIIFRRRSIWEATITNSFSQPFFFFQKIPGLGCDAPQSIVQTPIGTFFLDSYTNGVYLLGIDGSVTNVGEPIIVDLMAHIKHKHTETQEDVVGSFSFNYAEYQLLLLEEDNLDIGRVWKYNAKFQDWYYHEYPNIAHITNLEFVSGTLSIDELAGTIDSLTGTIDELGVQESTRESTFFASSHDGDVYFEDGDTYTDYGNIYTSIRESKMFSLPIDAEYVVQLDLEFVPLSDTGAIVLQFKKDNGDTWETYKTHNWVVADKNKKIRARAKKNVRCRLYQFRIVSTTGLFELDKFIIKIDQAGDTKR